ncbi:hypothetical protein RRG08_026603, partial [Elysia crispata]
LGSRAYSEGPGGEDARTSAAMHVGQKGWQADTLLISVTQFCAGHECHSWPGVCVCWSPGTTRPDHVYTADRGVCSSSSSSPLTQLAVWTVDDKINRGRWLLAICGHPSPDGTQSHGGQSRQRRRPSRLPSIEVTGRSLGLTEAQLASTTLTNTTKTLTTAARGGV